jgi:tetratricopeptide (TPR) repeat protein
MELMATLAATAFGLSSVRASEVSGEEIMPWLAGGVTACWDLGRGNDLLLASSVVSTYIPTLTALTAQQRYRKAAAKLAGEAWLLKATLGWHTESLSNALQYGMEAERFAKMAEDYTLQVDALHRVGMIHYYSKRYDKALVKLEEAQNIIEHNYVPRTVPRTIYMDIATYQACNGRPDEAKKSMKKAYKYFGAFPDADNPTASMLGYDAPNTIRWEGLALSHLGDHSTALDSYQQIAEKPTGIAERIRVELLCNQLHSKLCLKDKDLEECVALWSNAITGAKALQSEQRYNEAVILLETMECIWPGEKRIEDLKLLLAHW